MGGSEKAKTKSTGSETREDRLKKALKANMARRKAQARQRAGTDKTAGAEESR